jgi:hypothetical protein
MARAMTGSPGVETRVHRRGSSASSAGNRVIIETNASRMAAPDTNPNSRMPWKSVSVNTMKAPIAVRAPSSSAAPPRSPVRRTAATTVGAPASSSSKR